MKSVTCDACGQDLTLTGNSVDYRLVLAAEPIPSWGGAVTDMLIHPPVERPHHFCSLRCLDDWRAEKLA